VLRFGVAERETRAEIAPAPFEVGPRETGKTGIELDVLAQRQPWYRLTFCPM
jgi:hypothetical protein